MKQKKKRRKKEIREKEKTKKRLIKNKMIRDIGTLFLWEEKDYYKPRRKSNFRNNRYIEYESNSDKKSKLSLDEYLNKTKRYFRYVIIDLQSSDTWNIQLLIAPNLKMS